MIRKTGGIFFSIQLTNTLSRNAKFSRSCSRDPVPIPGYCQFISNPSNSCLLIRKGIHSNIYNFEIRYIYYIHCAITYLIKVKTLSMKTLRFSGLSAMSEYFPRCSSGPPMAIETFSFGFFSFKLTNFLYWPALCQKYFDRKFI